jgi:hypothetical protein
LVCLCHFSQCKHIKLRKTFCSFPDFPLHCCISPLLPSSFKPSLSRYPRNNLLLKSTPPPHLNIPGKRLQKNLRINVDKISALQTFVQITFTMQQSAKLVMETGDVYTLHVYTPYRVPAPHNTAKIQLVFFIQRIMKRKYGFRDASNSRNKRPTLPLDPLLAKINALYNFVRL